MRCQRFAFVKLPAIGLVLLLLTPGTLSESGGAGRLLGSGMAWVEDGRERERYIRVHVPKHAKDSWVDISRLEPVHHTLPVQAHLSYVPRHHA